MAFMVSPGVQVQEKDLTNIIPAVATSVGGFAGIYEWGPALEATTVTSEKDLIAKFGYPRTSTVAGSNTRDDWYSAANFLAYSNNLQVVRVLPEGARNAASEPVVAATNKISVVITGTPNGTTSFTLPYDGTTTTTFTPNDENDLGSIAAGFVDALVGVGATNVTVDSDAIAGIVDPTVLYDAASYTLPTSVNVNGVTFTYFTNTELDTDATSSTSASIKNLDDFLVEQSTLVNGSVYARYPGKLGNSVGILIVDAGITDSDFNSTPIIGDSTKLSDLFDDKPGTSVWAQNNFGTLEDEVHIVVYTVDASITGSPNEVLETYAYLSKAKNAKTADGGQNYYVDRVNGESQWVYVRNEETAATLPVIPYTAGTQTAIGSTVTGTSAPVFVKFLTNFKGLVGIRSYTLNGGADGGQVSDADYVEAYDLFADAESIDVNLLITGSQGTRVGQASKVVQKHVVELAEKRKDAIAFVSPDYASAVANPSATKIVDYFNNSTDGFNSTSYAVFDSGWKRQYDRYNDEYFWAPLNSDIAGLNARTDYTNDAWWSPAGLNRGFIKNVVKLSFNPNQTDRDTIYTKRINPVVTFRGQGTLLYGDKTALSRPSAFDRINVRRLFIVLEKAIATAAKFQLFEFNDDITRRVFVNAVEPFLADIKTKRGMTDFKVVCDNTNNTGEVIDQNRFVADIYIKPARAINYITLSFAAVRTGVSFNEVTGA